ncbi:MAG: hypothetical protein HQK86_01855 [Nitrospinae bacterium]|nr:hypothetical protein [Nitrospinota bacterium]
MTPSRALDLANIALAGIVGLVAADSAMKGIYTASDVSFTAVKHEAHAPKSSAPGRFKASFLKQVKTPEANAQSDVSALIKLSGVIVNPSDSLKSSAIFIIRGKESVLKRVGEEITDAVNLESIEKMGAVVKRGGVETVLNVESGGAEEGSGQLLITSEPPAPPRQSSDSQQAQPGLVTSDPDHKIVKPLSLR